MNKSEKTIQTSILNYLKKLQQQGLPIFYERRQAGGFSYKKGIPDIYFTYYSLHFEVEVKKETGELSSAQETRRLIFQNSYVPHLTITSLDSFKKFMSELQKYDMAILDISQVLLELSKLYQI
jgi:hypothetical protein